MRPLLTKAFSKCRMAGKIGGVPIYLKLTGVRNSVEYCRSTIVHQIRRGNRDNLGIIFLIFTLKHIL